MFTRRPYAFVALGLVLGCGAAPPTNAEHSDRADTRGWSRAFDDLARDLVAQVDDGAGLTVAVLDFRGTHGEVGIGARARDALAQRLLASRRFAALVERAALDRALEEMRFQRIGAAANEFDESTVIAAARTRGASAVVIGVAEPLANACHLTARMVRVEDGVVVAITTAEVALDDPHVAGQCGDAARVQTVQVVEQPPQPTMVLMPQRSQPTAAPRGHDMMTPPFAGRVYFGHIPFERNDLALSVYVRANNALVEVYVDGSPAPVVINGRLIERTVARGDHAGQTVSILPGNTPPYGAVQFGSPGQHSLEWWCYTDVAGVGLVQSHRRARNVRIPRNFNEGFGCH